MPNPPTESRYHHGDLRNALVEAGTALLAEHGAALSLRQVAAEVGVTHAAAYRHFADRESLLVEIARRGYVDLTRQMKRAARRADSPRGTLEALVVAYVRFAWKRRAQYALMLGPRLDRQNRHPSLDEAAHAAVSTLTAAVRAYLETDDPRRVRDVGIAIWCLVHGYATNLLQRRTHVRTLREAERYVIELIAPLLSGARAQGA